MSHNGVFTSFNGTDVNCSPYLAHVRAKLQIKIRAEFKMAQQLNIVLPQQVVRHYKTK